MIDEQKEVLLLFCDARVDKDNPLVLHFGNVCVVASIQPDCIKPKYVHSSYKKSRTVSRVSEVPFYELFSIAEGLENVARIKAKTTEVVACNDCSGTIDLLSRLGTESSSVSFKHKSLYLESLGENYNQHTGFYWLRRNHKGIVLADLVSRCKHISDLEKSPVKEKYAMLSKEILDGFLPLEILKTIPVRVLEG